MYPGRLIVAVLHRKETRLIVLVANKVRIALAPLQVGLHGHVGASSGIGTVICHLPHAYNAREFTEVLARWRAHQVGPYVTIRADWEKSPRNVSSIELPGSSMDCKRTWTLLVTIGPAAGGTAS
jgi:hypothetical protein